MSDATVKDADDLDREERRIEPSRRLLVLRDGRLVEVTSGPRLETR